MNKYRHLALLLLCSCISTLAAAQEGTPAMADAMRSNGKIYVVVAVMVIIFLGIVLYLIRMERQIKKLEERNHSDASYTHQNN